jgi:hypothetical protein
MGSSEYGSTTMSESLRVLVPHSNKLVAMLSEARRGSKKAYGSRSTLKVATSSRTSRAKPLHGEIQSAQRKFHAHCRS